MVNQYIVEPMVSGKHEESHKKPKHKWPQSILTLRSLQRRNEWPELSDSKFELSPLIMIRIVVFLQIKNNKLLKDPYSMKTHLVKRDKYKYYRFHQDYNHNMEDYWDLKEQIEELNGDTSGGEAN